MARARLLTAAIVTLLIVSWPVRAESLQWDLPCESQRVVRIEILGPHGELVGQLLTQDGTRRRFNGWREDLDPRPGMVAGRLDALVLSPGSYRQRRSCGDELSELPLTATAPPERMVVVRTRPEAVSVRGWREDPLGGWDGLSWAPVDSQGLALLGITQGDAGWSVAATAISAAVERVDSSSGSITLSSVRPAPAPRPLAGSSWALRLVLIPMATLLLGLLGWQAWRVRRARGLALAIAVSAGLGLGAVWRVLASPSTRLLSADPMSTDPVDSVAQIAAAAESLARLSSVTRSFQFPEGSDWLVNGPSWLGYALPAILSSLFDPVLAHNLGMGAGVAALALVSWALARSLGVGPGLSLGVAVASSWAPSVLGEVQQASIDRSMLWCVPLFFLCLHRAAERPGWRWPAATGAVLGAALYCQVHYALYLLAALPLLALYRLVIGPRLAPLGRLVLVAGVALIVMGPGLLVLERGTRDTPWREDTSSLVATGIDPFQPFSAEEASAHLRRFDPALGGSDDPDMSSPKARLLSTIARAAPIELVAAPAQRFAGGALYWVFAALALVVAGTRRRTASMAAVDVAILALLALGPFLRTRGQVFALPLPYYLDFLLVPGFEQLKQPQRLLIMAATIAPIPLALGVQGLGEWLHRRRPSLSKAPGWLTPLVALLLGVVLVSVPLAGPPASVSPSAAGGQAAPARVGPSLPVAITYPEPLALRGLERAPALVLPVQQPLPPEVTLATMRAGLRLVNEAPYGLPGGRGTPLWYETNRFLYCASTAAGSDRPHQLHSCAQLEPDIAALSVAGLRYVVLFRDLLPGEGLAPPAERFLDRWLPRVAEDDVIVVWQIAPASPRTHP